MGVCGVGANIITENFKKVKTEEGQKLRKSLRNSQEWKEFPREDKVIQPHSLGDDKDWTKSEVTGTRLFSGPPINKTTGETTCSTHVPLAQEIFGTLLMCCPPTSTVEAHYAHLFLN